MPLLACCGPTKLRVSAGVAKLGGKQEAVLQGNRQGCDHPTAKNHLFSPCNGILGLLTWCFVFFCLLLCFFCLLLCFFLHRELRVCAPPAPGEQSVPLLRGEAAKEAEIGQGTSSPAPLHTAGGCFTPSQHRPPHGPAARPALSSLSPRGSSLRDQPAAGAQTPRGLPPRTKPGNRGCKRSPGD